MQRTKRKKGKVGYIIAVRKHPHCGFKITVHVKNNNEYANSTLSDWLANLKSLYKPMKSKTNTGVFYAHIFQRFQQVVCNDF